MSSEPPATGAQPPGRYQRVQQILNQAAGDSKADYQGVGRFWNLPLADFLTVVVCQVRMSAPAAGEAAPTGCPVTSPAAATGTPCCHAGPKPPPPPPVPAVGSPSAARGARSGLIIGLKGAWPFDGTQFPRLPGAASPWPPEISTSSRGGSTTAAPRRRRRRRSPRSTCKAWPREPFRTWFPSPMPMSPSAKRGNSSSDRILNTSVIPRLPISAPRDRGIDQAQRLAARYAELLFVGATPR